MEEASTAQAGNWPERQPEGARPLRGCPAFTPARASPTSVPPSSEDPLELVWSEMGEFSNEDICRYID